MRAIGRLTAEMRRGRPRLHIFFSENIYNSPTNREENLHAGAGPKWAREKLHWRLQVIPGDPVILPSGKARKQVNGPALL
jgi:hypothetical protein